MHARLLLLLSAAGHYAQLPLLYQPAEYALSRALVLLYFICARDALRDRLCWLVAAEGAGQAGANGGAGSAIHTRAIHTRGGGDAPAGDVGGSHGPVAREASWREQPLSGRGDGAAEARPDTRTGIPPRADETLLRWWEAAYLAGFLPLEAFTSALHPLLFGARLPFLPLLCTSAYCAVGVHYCAALSLALWRQQRQLGDRLAEPIGAPAAQLVK